MFKSTCFPNRRKSLCPDRTTTTLGTQDGFYNVSAQTGFLTELKCWIKWSPQVHQCNVLEELIKRTEGRSYLSKVVLLVSIKSQEECGVTFKSLAELQALAATEVFLFFPLINSKIYLRRATELFYGFGPKSLGTNRVYVGNRRWLSHTSSSKLSFHKHNVNPSMSWQRWNCWALRWRMLGLWGSRLYPLLISINFREIFANILLWVSGEAESWNQTIRTVSNKNCGSFAGHKFLNSVSMI